MSDALVEQWTAEQLHQASLAVFSDSNLSFTVRSTPATLHTRGAEGVPSVYRFANCTVEGLKTVGGLDISFRNSSGDEGVAVLVVLSFPELKVLHTVSRRIDLSSTPYVHSFLSFREADHYAALVDDSRAIPGATMPQVLFVDGNGRWHPRQAGSAVAVGLKTGIPTVGVAKEYHPLQPSSPSLPSSHSPDPSGPFPPDFRSNQKGMRKACQHLLQQRDDWLGLPAPQSSTKEPAASQPGPDFDRNEYWGAAVLTSPSRTASNPVYVSPGHQLSITTCIDLVLSCCTESKVPEPIRKADSIGRAEVRKIWGTCEG
ncbi:hypothetical protein JCM11641_004445 [Rhodosporidiobolus odoratus]